MRTFRRREAHSCSAKSPCDHALTHCAPSCSASPLKGYFLNVAFAVLPRLPLLWQHLIQLSSICFGLLVVTHWPPSPL